MVVVVVVVVKACRIERAAMLSWPVEILHREYGSGIVL
jgi:hypothetical protein